MIEAVNLFHIKQTLGIKLTGIWILDLKEYAITALDHI